MLNFCNKPVSYANKSENKFTSMPINALIRRKKFTERDFVVNVHTGDKQNANELPTNEELKRWWKKTQMERFPGARRAFVFCSFASVRTFIPFSFLFVYFSHLFILIWLCVIFPLFNLCTGALYFLWKMKHFLTHRHSDVAPNLS